MKRLNNACQHDMSEALSSESEGAIDFLVKK